MQAKRIQVNEANTGAGGQVNVILEVPAEPREQVNFHNIWIGVSCESQDAMVNAQGTWVLYVLPDLTTAIPAWSDGTINLENANALIIACGVWSASNESPFNLSPTQIKSSRNVNSGGRLILTSHSAGVTAGLVSNRVMLCAHTVRA